MQWSKETASGHDSWMGMFLYLEMAIELPIVLFTVYRLGVQRKGTSGAHELALLVYSFQTAFTTAVCIHDVLYWDTSVYTAEVKNKVIGMSYLPWVIVRKYALLQRGENPADRHSFLALCRRGIQDPCPFQCCRRCPGWQEGTLMDKIRDTKVDRYQRQRLNCKRDPLTPNPWYP